MNKQTDRQDGQTDRPFYLDVTEKVNTELEERYEGGARNYLPAG